MNIVKVVGKMSEFKLYSLYINDKLIFRCWEDGSKMINGMSEVQYALSNCLTYPNDDLKIVINSKEKVDEFESEQEMVIKTVRKIPVEIKTIEGENTVGENNNKFRDKNRLGKPF
jgi:hypothetical protein